MDLLQVANEINLELAHIQSVNKQVLDEQRRVAVFNNIVAYIADGLVDLIQLSISERNDPQRSILSWMYDLQNQRYPLRTGPSLQEILTLLEHNPDAAMFLTYNVRWSRRFQEMDERFKARVLRSTTSAQGLGRTDHAPTPSVGPQESKSDRAESQATTTIRQVDLGPLESELLTLEQETHLIDKKKVKKVMESVLQCIDGRYIQGVQIMMFGSDQEKPIFKWYFELGPEMQLVRRGDSLETVLAVAKELKRRCQLIIQPILTQQFEQRPQKEQQAAMKEMIWADDFKTDAGSANI